MSTTTQSDAVSPPPLTIDQIQRAKLAAEQSILRTLSDFETLTGLSVRAVDMDRMPLVGRSAPYVVCVKLDVRL